MRAGIDLGTTYSEMAAVDDFGKTELLQQHHIYGTPSVFYCDEDKEIYIGEAAVQNGEGDPANMVLDVKMRLDEKFSLPNGEFTSEEIVSSIYKEVIDQGITIAEDKSFSKENDKLKIDGIVLTCPNKFNDQERELILHAAAYCNGRKAAPQPVLAIIKEPVAAAIFYIDYNKDNPNEAMRVNDGDAILVYDLGGGTCDIALVQYTPNAQVLFQVIDSDMLRIGGRNWDEKISEYLTQQFIENANVELTPERKNQIRKKAEEMKRGLGLKQNSTDPMVSSFFNYTFNTMPRRMRFQLSLEKFQELTNELLDKTMECLTTMYNRHRNNYIIKNVVCVGGGCRMPMIKQTIADRIPDCICRLADNPEYAIVKGAALYANKLTNATPILDMVPRIAATEESVSQSPETTETISQPDSKPPVPGPAILGDIASFSYGFELFKTNNSQELVIQNLITQGTPLPAEGTFPCRPKNNGVSFKIYRSECKNKICDINDPSAEYIKDLIVDLNGIQNPHEIQIIATMKLDENQLLELTASLSNGIKKSITLDCSKYDPE